MIELLHKNNITLEHPLFSKQCYDELIKSYDLLFSYIKPININYEVFEDCCGLINKNVVKDIIN